MVFHYKIIEFLGGGAMGQVYRAEDTLLHRPVALKFLPAQLTEDPEASRRFMREARATSSLDHPNICAIHEIAQAPDGSWFIAMALYEGRTLKKALADGPLAPGRALNYARQIALGLSNAHAHDVVHRDIKPANIIITDNDDVKILDFGLARLLGQARLTRTGTVMGTAAYMSPEQARGEDVGPGSDIWSLGVVLYEMLAGQVPFEGESDVAMIYSVLNSDPAPLPRPVCKHSEICTEIIRRCLTRNPLDRYPSVQAVADDIDLALAGSGIPHRSRPSGSSIFASPRRPRRQLLLPALVTLALLGALAWPRSRELLRSVMPFTAAQEQTGVAVIPFTFTGTDEDAAAFGRGLSTMINDRLSGLEQYSRRFWVVPAAEISRREIADETAARTSEGVDLAVTGTGTLSGNTITLQVTIHDFRDHSRTTREFRDFSGNLKTWQSDLPQWLTGLVDPDLAASAQRWAGGRNTNVPASFLAYQHGLGNLELASGGADDPHTDAAIAFLQRAVASDSSFACAWAQLGQAVWLKYQNNDADQVAQAEAYLAAAARLDSTAVLPHYYLGNIKARSGQSAAAFAEYQQALKRDPVHEPTLYRVGYLHYQLGENKDAESAYYRAIDARPRYPRAFRNVGVYHFMQGEYPGARENFQAMVDLVPDDHVGYYLLGAAYFEEGDYDHSKTLFKKSLALKETYEGFANLGTLYYYDQRYIDSIAMCREALELRPEDFSTWRTLASASRFAPGHADSVKPAFEKAMECLRKELDLNPDDPHLRADQASFYAVLGPRETAFSILADLETKYVDLDPEVMFSMASTYEDLGNRDRALDWLEAAVGKDLSFKKVEHYPELKNLRSHPRYIALRDRYLK